MHNPIWEQRVQEIQQHMQKSAAALEADVSKLRAARASPQLLEPVRVAYYGNTVPLSQVASIAVESARMLVVTPWEKSMLSSIEKAIRIAELGLNPTVVGVIVRIPLPPLTEERRRDLVRLVREYGERARVSVRNIRRDANQEIKTGLKEKAITEDEERRSQLEVQKITDQCIERIDAIVAYKERELMEV